MSSTAAQATDTTEIREYVSSIGAFFLLNKKGKLLALRGVKVSDDLASFVPKAANADLTALYPLVANIKQSSVERYALDRAHLYTLGGFKVPNAFRALQRIDFIDFCAE